MLTRLLSLLCAFALLAGCGGGQAAPQPDAGQPPGLRYTPLPTVLAAPAGGLVSTAGYYYNRGGGAVLVGGLSFGGEQPAPLNDLPAQQIWLGDNSNSELEGGLRSSGEVRYAPLLARGRLDGPGSYGPDGRYPFQLSNPSLTLLVPTLLTVTALLEKAFTYDGQFVRVRGVLLTDADSTLLVDQLGAGGVPPRSSHQLKLAAPVDDEALLGRLQASANGSAHYGPVAVEGFWRAGTLLPLSIAPD